MPKAERIRFSDLTVKEDVVRFVENFFGFPASASCDLDPVDDAVGKEAKD